MNYKNTGLKLKEISRGATKIFRAMNLISDIIPFYNNYSHYLRDLSDIITNYGSITIVENDGSRYEDCLLNNYNYNLFHYSYYFKNIITKNKKAKIKHYCKKLNLGLKYISNI